MVETAYLSERCEAGAESQIKHISTDVSLPSLVLKISVVVLKHTFLDMKQLKAPENLVCSKTFLETIQN